MPYRERSELPEGVRENLPAHAQDIYLAAFNSAWDGYADPDDRAGDATREETAHKVAWSAVKGQYEKGEDGRWREKEA